MNTPLVAPFAWHTQTPSLPLLHAYAKLALNRTHFAMHHHCETEAIPTPQVTVIELRHYATHNVSTNDTCCQPPAGVGDSAKGVRHPVVIYIVYLQAYPENISESHLSLFFYLSQSTAGRRRSTT